MITRSLAIAVGLFFSAAPTLAGAADAEAGKALTAQHCNRCHDSRMYTRPDRRVKSLQELRTQVRRCELSLGLKWFDQDIDNVAAYLNDTYYQFQ